jgi:hypothetical protein
MIMPIEFRCGECNKQLRVSDDAVGRRARCPDCGHIQDVPEVTTPFSQPGAASSTPFDEAAGSTPFAADVDAKSEESPSQNPYQAPPTTLGTTWSVSPTIVPRHVVEAKVQGPATALIVLSALVLALVAFGCASICFLLAIGEADGEILAQMIGAAFTALIYGVVLAGALKMRRMQNYPLAMLASVLAMLPCSCCCVIGMPFGIWSLLVLNDPAVRAAFE